MNNASFHCATLRHTRLQRRAVHVRYRQPEPVASRHGILDPWQVRKPGQKFLRACMEYDF